MFHKLRAYSSANIGEGIETKAGDDDDDDDDMKSLKDGRRNENSQRNKRRRRRKEVDEVIVDILILSLSELSFQESKRYSTEERKNFNPKSPFDSFTST